MERSDKTATAMLFEPYLLEQIGRVQQPPSCERPFASPPTAGKIDLSEKIGRGISNSSPRETVQDSLPAGEAGTRYL